MNEEHRTTENWEAALNMITSDAVTSVREHMKTTDQGAPIAAAMFVIHADGSMSLSSGGNGNVAQDRLMLAAACSAVQKELMQLALGDNGANLMALLDKLGSEH